MSYKSLYKIERFSDALNKWVVFCQFDCMQKSFAMGAWAMLTSFCDTKNEYRLVKDENEVVEHCTKQTINLN
jgi:hypothetical protein